MSKKCKSHSSRSVCLFLRAFETINSLDPTTECSSWALTNSIVSVCGKTELVGTHNLVWGIGVGVRCVFTYFCWWERGDYLVDCEASEQEMRKRWDAINTFMWPWGIWMMRAGWRRVESCRRILLHPQGIWGGVSSLCTPLPQTLPAGAPGAPWTRVQSRHPEGGVGSRHFRSPSCCISLPQQRQKKPRCVTGTSSLIFQTLLGSVLTFGSAAAAKSLQSCPTLCDPIDGSPPGSPVPGILQARTLEWVAISFSNAWKWKVKVKPLSHVRLFVTPWTAAHQAPPSMGFSRQEYWSGLPSPSPHLWL